MHATKYSTHILIPMVADLFHYGHVAFLQKVREDNPDGVICIGLIPCSIVETYKRKPIMNFDERKKALESCKYVDSILELNQLELTEHFLLKNNIDLVIHAHNTDEHEKYSFFWKNIPYKFIRYDYTKGISTTDVIERVISYHHS